MKYGEYLRKAEILAHEAIVDINNACYNKAVSALWFMIEAILRAILNRYKQSMPSKSGAVIAKTIDFVKDLGFGAEDIKELNVASTLYTLRNEVDHKRTVANKKTVQKALLCARKTLQVLRRLMLDRVPDVVFTIDNIASKLDKVGP